MSVNYVFCALFCMNIFFEKLVTNQQSVLADGISLKCKYTDPYCSNRIGGDNLTNIRDFWISVMLWTSSSWLKHFHNAYGEVSILNQDPSILQIFLIGLAGTKLITLLSVEIDHWPPLICWHLVDRRSNSPHSTQPRRSKILGLE